VRLFIEHKIHSITATERSEERRVAILRTDGCRLRVAETCSVPVPTLVPSRAPHRRDREHLPTAPRHPSPKNQARSRLTCPPLFSLVSRFSKGPFSERMSQVASTGPQGSRRSLPAGAASSLSDSAHTLNAGARMCSDHSYPQERGAASLA
jgi:hypothetical protein